ncbi:hypothetical protein CEUSTIGMA_g1792.t1 [Chlamydomonas eustigma]|uniref:NADH-ubiquinone oxidoreductase chain 3 n=1 Tax=Chlamydomonas eustigma TaxID=1157962 RepID=A0A250WU42_9CHLO|nr:hypothetical protein CEUSTIGMA_g1792.t1 [Chlamydomonas eustigma]|eukprot:GAX74343.1 hypothetical protein CEUSTIGMA_g1792.t1 [Chlamydomonas eustigma]
MALRGAVKNTFNVGFPRFFAGSISPLTEGLIPAVLESDEKEQQSSSLMVNAQKNLLESAAALGKVQLFNCNQRAFSTTSIASSLSPLRPSLKQTLLKRTTNQAIPLPYQIQRRQLNAWSPAQRYFVEGDHVINAEINRTFQFTGLDSGSFYPFVVYTVIATAIATVFMVLPWLVAPQRVDLDKSSAYECGFDAFGEARQTFSVSFYLVSIMYLLFDIEICYLFPYVMSHANPQMFWTMNLFLSLLVVGFIYEWGVGALEWRS